MSANRALARIERGKPRRLPAGRAHDNGLPYVGNDQVDRALELRALGEHARANLIEQCVGLGPCGLRACPRCSAVMLEQAKSTATEVLRNLDRSHRLRIVAWSNRAGELATVWARLRVGLGWLIRPGHMRALRQALGIVRIIDASDAPHGAVAVDLIIDIDALDFRRLERNVLRLPGCPNVRFHDLGRFADHPLKLLPSCLPAEHWFPPPRTTSLERLGAVLQAQHRRRLFFVWSGHGRLPHESRRKAGA